MQPITQLLSQPLIHTHWDSLILHSIEVFLQSFRSCIVGTMSHSTEAGSWASTPGRRRNMQAIRSRDTRPEMAIRRALHRLGLRYRVAIAPEPSLRRRADIVFTKARVAVFIDGCFWHGCPTHGRKRFNHNVDYWPAKIKTNMARDRDTTEQLRQAGWTVMRFWEHEEEKKVVEAICCTIRTSAAKIPAGHGKAITA